MAKLKTRLLPFFFVLLLLLPLTFLPKGEIVLWVNGYRNPFLDAFFIRASALGNGLTVLIAVILVLPFRLKWLGVFILSFLFQVIIVLLFKKGIFNGELRPYLYYKEAGQVHLLNLLEGVKIRYVNTFPSGHTATISFLVTFFAILARNTVASWTLMLICLLVGFSRIYLVQHFFNDVYFGILFGLLSSMVGYYYIQKYPRKWHSCKIKIDLQNIQRTTQSALKQLFQN